MKNLITALVASFSFVSVSVAQFVISDIEVYKDDVLITINQSDNYHHTVWWSTNLVDWSMANDEDNTLGQVRDVGVGVVRYDLNNDVFEFISNAYFQVRSFPQNRDICDVQTDLRVGSVGADIVTVQEFLVSSNYLNLADGFYGHFDEGMLMALAAFQADQGIVHTVGHYGPITRAVICGSVHGQIDVTLVDQSSGFEGDPGEPDYRGFFEVIVEVENLADQDVYIRKDFWSHWVNVVWQGTPINVLENSVVGLTEFGADESSHPSWWKIREGDSARLTFVLTLLPENIGSHRMEFKGLLWSDQIPADPDDQSGGQIFLLEDIHTDQVFL